MQELSFLPGKPGKFGAVLMKGGVLFSFYSKNASRAVLYLFNSAKDKSPSISYELDPLVNKTGNVWHVFVHSLKAGALYLYRLDGEYNPPAGKRFNFNKYLIDPYAKALTRGSVFRSYNLQREKGLAGIENGLLSDLSDFPKCVVVDDEAFDWEGDKALNYPAEKCIIYEAHLKGFTASETCNVRKRGTYKAFIEKIPYLKELGITSVEFLPVFHFDRDENSNTNPKTGEKLYNYWGYSTLAFFAPSSDFASSASPLAPVNEMKSLVKALHKEGIEVILDVVFNHTAEGNEKGYTFSMRGFENSAYYMLPEDAKQYYMNYSGCGNTINSAHAVVTDFIIECLRYWVAEYHIDGFRFDLASVLTRDRRGNISGHPFLTHAISNDPYLASTKIIAEPWDAGGGYHVGHFPGGRWSEWNDRYRNDIRRFIRGDAGLSTQAATRIAGSSDLYNHSGRTPAASVNFITSHDGFTMKDLVSYNYKHNEENAEQNRDGSDDNNSYNYGFEGEVTNKKIERAREKAMKNFFLCLLVSQGIPMINMGDEVARTQRGNNNAYCQDNDISYFNWDLVEKNASLLHFVKTLINFRREHSLFMRTSFFQEGSHDIEWFDSASRVPEWKERFLAFRLNEANGEAVYAAFNTDIYDVTVTLPAPKNGKKWHLVADTAMKEYIKQGCKECPLEEQRRYVLLSQSALLLLAR